MGVPDASTEETLQFAARLDGFALDPVYSGKGTTSLIGLLRSGRVAGGRFAGLGPVAKLHIGGGATSVGSSASGTSDQRQGGPVGVARA
jgi:1-aminocyclopropane-1-carboxylate deaminase/D-cysteine desulfhydrase-like pyridoxal-dependent ACC family enzyme